MFLSVNDNYFNNIKKYLPPALFLSHPGEGINSRVLGVVRVALTALVLTLAYVVYRIVIHRERVEKITLEEYLATFPGDLRSLPVFEVLQKELVDLYGTTLYEKGAFDKAVRDFIESKIDWQVCLLGDSNEDVDEVVSREFLDWVALRSSLGFCEGEEFVDWIDYFSISAEEKKNCGREELEAYKWLHAQFQASFQGHKCRVKEYKLFMTACIRGQLDDERTYSMQSKWGFLIRHFDLEMVNQNLEVIIIEEFLDYFWVHYPYKHSCKRIHLNFSEEMKKNFNGRRCTLAQFAVMVGEYVDGRISYYNGLPGSQAADCKAYFKAIKSRMQQAVKSGEMVL